MRVFISAGEPSGDIHGANLIQQLRRLRPDVECVGFGGKHMTAAGAELLYPLTDLAVMWFTRVLAQATTFLSLLSRADRYFRHHRPDAVVLIDYPGFNWWIARRAKAHGIPVFYFVPPQLWAWASWRVNKMRRFVDHILCSLPFEPAWYASHGITAHYVGHPYFDEAPSQQLDASFMRPYQTGAGPIVGILPGSRNQEVERNFSTQLEAASKIARARPDARFLVACYKHQQQKMVRERLLAFPGLSIETHVGRTPEVIALSDACLAVSGSVSLELLHRGTPSVIVYRVVGWHLGIARWFMKAKHICLVNLLADRVLYPEYLCTRDESLAISQDILRWLNVPEERQAIDVALAELRGRVAQPGACAKAAQFVLEHAAGTRTRVA